MLLLFFASIWIEKEPSSNGRDQVEVLFERDDDVATAFRRAVADVRDWVMLRGLAEDASRVDYQAAMAMLKAGWTDAEVRAGMLAGSDGLAQRHKDPEDYVRRTVRRAGIDLAINGQVSTASMPTGQRARVSAASRPS